MVAAFLLGGCSAEVAMFRADSSWWGRGAAEPAAVGSVRPDGFFNPEACSASEAPVRPIGLGMTECDLIRTAGPSDLIELRRDARGQPMSVITYPQGERAGTYTFVSGALVSIERFPEGPGVQAPTRFR